MKTKPLRVQETSDIRIELFARDYSFNKETAIETKQSRAREFTQNVTKGQRKLKMKLLTVYMHIGRRQLALPLCHIRIKCLIKLLKSFL